MYIGETLRNLFKRSKEHSHSNKDEGSFMRKHMEMFHRGKEGQFKARVSHRNNDSLSRQVREGALNRRSIMPLINNKTEWHQPSLYTIRNEFSREQEC